jgi:hypothetical protein
MKLIRNWFWISKMNLIHLQKQILNLPYICIHRKNIYKYPDVKLIVKCADDVLTKECSRLILANMSKYFEKVFELEGYTVENAMRVYKLEIPFTKKSVDQSIDMIYENFIQSTMEVALENILTLNYFNIPDEILENMIAYLISYFENHLLISEYVDQFYCLLEEYQIFCESKTKNLKQRIEHLTSFKTMDTVIFKEGMEVLETNKKYVIKFSLGNDLLISNNPKGSLDFQMDDKFIVKADVKSYSKDIPDNHYMIGISVKPFNEKENLSFDESMVIDRNSSKEFMRRVSLKFDIYNGFEDPLINKEHSHSRFRPAIDYERFPTLMDTISNCRSTIGFFYPKEKINSMTFVIVSIEYLD